MASAPPDYSTGMLRLPSEILLKITQYLSWSDRKSLRLQSREYAQFFGSIPRKYWLADIVGVAEYILCESTASLLLLVRFGWVVTVRRHKGRPAIVRPDGGHVDICRSQGFHGQRKDRHGEAYGRPPGREIAAPAARRQY